MSSLETNGGGGAVDAEFVTEADWIPGFWNYLLNLDREDLIAELVQNDLDQDATRTEITFEQDRLISDGDGRPVEADGWKRLRIIQGAGVRAPAKRGKIGVKNHGLKTAFTIGDEIRLMSARQAIVQTLYALGRDRPPHPGASREPRPDPLAPASGCRIIIRYRDADIEPPHGEANVLGATSSQEIDELFLSACARAPEQFAGIVSPEIVPRYEIVLRHWRLGEARFVFSCTRPRKMGKRIELFRRRCDVTGNARPLPDGLYEQAARRLVPLKGRLTQRVPHFFRRGRRFFVEVSWPIRRDGRPDIGMGRFRYPIGYPHDSQEARTGHATHFNAPIASDNARHGPARNEATNKQLRQHCEALLIDVLAKHTIPRWGSYGLNPLVPHEGLEHADETVRPLLAALVERNAIPILEWGDAVRLLATNQEIHRLQRRSIGTSRRESRRYKFVVPVMRRDPTKIHAALSVIAPRSESLLDPRTAPSIIELLADGRTKGFGDRFKTFDEHDAVARATGQGNEYFDAPADPEHEFAHPFLARGYLDVVYQLLVHEECDDATQDALLQKLRLPNAHGIPTSLEHLHANASLPSDIPGLRLPPILHPDLIGHAIFKRTKWRRPRYTMARFLEGDALRTADEQTRRLFWDWLRRNERLIAQRDRPKLADLAIWPDGSGDLLRICDLCDPRSRKVARVLAGSIHLPSEHVRKSKITSARSKAKASIRHVPTANEIATWLDTRMAAFVVGSTPNAAAILDLDRFEADLVVLLKDPAIARIVKAEGIVLPALARDGSIQHRAALVMPSRSNDRLALLERFVLRSKVRAAVLNRISPSVSAPTAGMLLETLAEDPGNFSALQSRLQRFMSCTEPGDDDRCALANMAILPLRGKPRPPSALAFKSTRGDYWGDWKLRISAKGLSQDDQGRYRAAGVTSAMPNQETSRAFFSWLSGQDEGVLQQHIPCVLRHVLHRDGPTAWGAAFTDVPFVPVKSRKGLRLVSLRTALRTPVYLPDAGDIGDAVILTDPVAMVVVDRAKEVNEPVTEPLRKMGIRSLREAMREPESVSGQGDVTPAGNEIIAKVRALRLPRFRRTFLKRLVALGVEPELVRHDWQERLSRISDIRLADNVESHYRFRGKRYSIDAHAGFDPATGVFWIRRKSSIGSASMYEAIAAQLVFRPAARPIHLLALERALELEITDPSFGQPSRSRHTSDFDEEHTLEDEAESHERGADGDGIGEAVFGHSPFEPDPARNVPDPGPIPTSPTGTSRRGNGATRQRNSEEPADQAPELEKEHIEALKRRHYVSHCQMCLCERPPLELAPRGSYIQWEEVRRRVVEAHHVDLKSAGGARHAGNLILLCKLHHDNYGRQLTRGAIIAALEGDTNERVIRFGTGNESASEVKGRTIRVVIPDSGELVEIFFTIEHATYWVAQGDARLRPPDSAVTLPGSQNG